MKKKCLCGGTLHDYSSDRKRNKSRNCFCDGLFWSQKGGPHKKASSVWCVHHPTGPTEEDYINKYNEYQT